MRQPLELLNNRSILTETGGFLREGYSHTVNLTSGCSFHGAACGTFCYAQQNHWVTKGREWDLYGIKKDIVDAYRRDYDRWRRPRGGERRPLRIYLSSSSDPYGPHEHRARLMPGLLKAMLDRPPDTLVIQSHGTLVARDIDLVIELSRRCELWVSLTVETDMVRIPGFPNHATPPAKRIATLQTFRDRGVATQATVSPLLPLVDPIAFANALDRACDRVVLDHYLLGDASPGGLRTRRTDFLERMEAAGFGRWNKLETFWEIRSIFDGILGEARVLISRDGFNEVGR